jgi:hypothetical protein
MKKRKLLFFFIAAILSISSVPVSASDKGTLADDLEMPDPLLGTTDPDKKKKIYGEEKIVISGDGAKNNEIIKPDPLLKTVEDKTESTAKDIELKSVLVTEDDQAIEPEDQLLKTTKKKKSSKNDELEMPDPLLDNMK